jgi:hypothetical protein
MLLPDTCHPITMSCLVGMMSLQIAVPATKELLSICLPIMCANGCLSKVKPGNRPFQDLRDLPNPAKALPDLRALDTQITRIMQSLHPTTSSEREPITLYDSCVELYQILVALKDVSYRKRANSVVLEAWHESCFSQQSFFKRFFQNTQHGVGLDHAKLCYEFVEAVHTELKEAHEMYTVILH